MMLVFQGDVVLVSFDPSLGHEPKKYRPAVVVSGDLFNSRSSLAIVAPVTSSNNGYPLHVYVSTDERENAVAGWVCLEQMRALDLNARHAQRIGEVNKEQLDRIRQFTGSIFDL